MIKFVIVVVIVVEFVYSIFKRSNDLMVMQNVKFIF